MRSRIGLYSSSPQPSRHGEQNTRDGEKRRAGKPADAVRQDVEDDGEADDRRGEQQRGQSEQEARRKYFLARVTKQEQPIAFCESCMALVATAPSPAGTSHDSTTI